MPTRPEIPLNVELPGSTPAAAAPVARGPGDVAVGHQHLRPLTSLRFIAALVVFVHHSIFFGAQELGTASKDYPYWYEAASQGALGVSFFFVLSGFILTWNYHERFRTIEPVALTQFWIARIGRIWPVHALTFLLACGFFVDDLVRTPLKTVLTGIANLTLAHGFIPLDGADGIPQSFNAPSWSLSNELFFYLMFPVLAWALVRVAASSPRWLIAIPGAWWALTLLAAITFGDDSMAEWFLYTYPVTRLGDFIAGICCGLLFIQLRKARASRSADVPAPRTFGARSWTLVEVGLLAVLAALVALSPLAPDALKYSSLYLPVMVVAIFVAASSTGLGARALCNSRLIFLGEISFSFYMLHWLVMAYAQTFGLYSVGLVPALIGILIFTTIASAFMHRLVELPMRDRIRARGDRWLASRGRWPAAH